MSVGSACEGADRGRAGPGSLRRTYSCCRCRGGGSNQETGVPAAYVDVGGAGSNKEFLLEPAPPTSTFARRRNSYTVLCLCGCLSPGGGWARPSVGGGGVLSKKPSLKKGYVTTWRVRTPPALQDAPKGLSAERALCVCVGAVLLRDGAAGSLASAERGGSEGGPGSGRAV